MTRVINSSILYSVIAFVSCCLILSGCGGSVPAPTHSASSDDYASQESALLLDLGCPDENEMFDLWVSHYSVIDIVAEDGETFHLEFQNLDPTEFAVWLNSDGTVTQYIEPVNSLISYSGVAHHPYSDDCPVQTFEGAWELKATISGTCKNDIVRIHIIEEWENPVLESDCVGPVSPGVGLFSAPELDLTFNLKDEIPTDSVKIEGTGPFQANYTYYLWPADQTLELVPLVPGQ